MAFSGKSGHHAGEAGSDHHHIMLLRSRRLGKQRGLGNLEPAQGSHSNSSSHAFKKIPSGYFLFLAFVRHEISSRFRKIQTPIG
jgi:hypothetical protein